MRLGGGDEGEVRGGGGGGGGKSGGEGKLRNAPYRPAALGPPIAVWRRAARTLCQRFDI